MIEIRIKCNDCNIDGAVTRGVSVPPHILRRSLKRQGWQVALPKGKDLCPSCIKLRRKEGS